MFHYTMCGLDNVWLKNGYTVRQTKHGEGVSIDHVEELDQAIALSLLTKKGPLTGKEFRFIRTQLGLSQEGLAKLIGMTEQTISLWERRKDGKSVPTHADAIVRTLYAERHNGNLKLSSAIDRINAVERLCHQRIVVKERRGAWKSSVETGDQDLVSA